MNKRSDVKAVKNLPLAKKRKGNKDHTQTTRTNETNDRLSVTTTDASKSHHSAKRGDATKDHHSVTNNDANKGHCLAIKNDGSKGRFSLGKGESTKDHSVNKKDSVKGRHLAISHRTLQSKSTRGSGSKKTCQRRIENLKKSKTTDTEKSNELNATVIPRFIPRTEKRSRFFKQNVDYSLNKSFREW